MSDLNLNFDTGLKNITMGSSTPDNNIQITSDNKIPNISSQPTSPLQSNSTPNLSVSDPMGIEFLVKGNNSSPTNSVENTPKSNKSEEFNFFKPSEDKGGIVNGDLPKINISETDDILINQNSQNIDDNSQEFKPIHRLTPQDIKNEKIDLLYKFKKLESQGIRTTMNYNMNSHLEDMRNEYIKLKKQREIDNSIKFQRKMLMACLTGIEFLNGRFDPFNVK